MVHMRYARCQAKYFLKKTRFLVVAGSSSLSCTVHRAVKPGVIAFLFYLVRTLVVPVGSSVL